MKRWATAKEIHEDILSDVVYAELNNTASKLAFLARNGRIDRRLREHEVAAGSKATAKGQIWEYNVPQARAFFSERKGRGNYVAVSKTRGPNLASGTRVTARIN